MMWHSKWWQAVKQRMPSSNCVLLAQNVVESEGGKESLESQGKLQRAGEMWLKQGMEFQTRDQHKPKYTGDVEQGNRATNHLKGMWIWGVKFVSLPLTDRTKIKLFPEIWSPLYLLLFSLISPPLFLQLPSILKNLKCSNIHLFIQQT